MKRIFQIIALAAMGAMPAKAQDADALFVKLSNGVTHALPFTDIRDAKLQGDSIVFNDTIGFSMNDVRQMWHEQAPTKLTIQYEGDTASIVNPYFLRGVSVCADGADVTVTNNNTVEELKTELSGSTTNGSFAYYGSYKTTLVLNALTLTNQKAAAAIDIQCGKRVVVELKKETVSTITDGKNGSQKAALYCKGHLEFDKSGELNVVGNTAHAIAAKEYIKLKKGDGVININSSANDGIHCKQYFLGNGMTVNMTKVGGDCIQCELDGAENEDGYADGSIVINGGTYVLINSTNGSKDGTDTKTAKGLNAEGNVVLAGGNISISMTGTGGKGIKADGTYTQGTENGEGPTLTVSTSGAKYSTSSSSSNNGGWPGGWPGGSSSSGSSSKAIKAMLEATVLGGQSVITTTTDGAEGLESKKSVTIKGGNHYFKCYDDCINSSGIVEFAGGNTVCYGYGNDAVDSNYGKTGAIKISGGSIFAYTTKGSPEEGLDCDNNSWIVVTGGIAISAGGSQGGGGGGGRPGSTSSSSSQSIGSSTQGYYLGSSPSSYSSSNYYTLYNTSGEAICTYKFEATVSNSLSLLTAPNLGKGSVTVKYGTSAPTEYEQCVANTQGKVVFYTNPTVTTKSTAATITAK